MLLLGAQKYLEVHVSIFLEPHRMRNKVFTCTDPLNRVQKPENKRAAPEGYIYSGTKYTFLERRVHFSVF